MDNVFKVVLVLYLDDMDIKDNVVEDDIFIKIYIIGKVVIRKGLLIDIVVCKIVLVLKMN